MSTSRRRSSKTYKKPRSKKERRWGYPSFKKKKSSHDKSGSKLKKMTYCCSVPKDDCNGSMQPDGMKVHNSGSEVLRCKKRHLTKNGFTFIKNTEYLNPHTGRIMILTYKGQRSKAGKADRYMSRNFNAVAW